jgi:hypothetical protein
MEKVKKYRNLVKQILSNYEALSQQSSPSELETEVVFDEERDHYILYTIGWWPKGRVCGATVHVRLRNGKFWVEEDWTEDGIATDLLEAGVPKEDIVLAFHPPDMRLHTEFAVA